MYRSAVSSVFLVTGAIVAADLLVRLIRRPASASAQSQSGVVRYLRLLMNLVGFASLAAVALSGFSVLFTEEGVMTGDRLIFHVISAPIFAVSAVGMALFWAHRNRFASADGGRLLSVGGWATPLRKLFFWMAIALTIPTLVSILLAMYPLFSPDDQQTLFRIHRYCAPFLAASGLLFGYFGVVSWREGSDD